MIARRISLATWLCTGIAVVALVAGIAVFPAASGQAVFVALDADHLVEISLTGRRLSPVWTVPTGYSLFTYALQHPLGAVTDRLLIQANGDGMTSRPIPLALWEPTTGRLHTVGADGAVVAVHTAPDGRDSTIAWLNLAACQPNGCLELTDSRTLNTRTVKSPVASGYFVHGGTFSPDGRRLAAFLSTGACAWNGPTAELAIVDVATRNARVIPDTCVNIGEPEAWTTWNVSSPSLVIGGLSRALRVDTSRWKVTQLRLPSRPDQLPNYSTVPVN